MTHDKLISSVAVSVRITMTSRNSVLYRSSVSRKRNSIPNNVYVRSAIIAAMKNEYGYGPFPSPPFLSAPPNVTYIFILQSHFDHSLPRGSRRRPSLLTFGPHPNGWQGSRKEARRGEGEEILHYGTDCGAILSFDRLFGLHSH